MKSLIDDALELHELQKSTKEALGTPDDEELAKIVEKLKVSITIVGCGGGGSNTVNRLTRRAFSVLTLSPPTATPSTS